MISVIVPVYGVEPYLRECIDSILNQTYRDFEIILVDDGSPDECGTICDEYANQDDRVRVFHTENHGLSAARNVGLIEARGEAISFIDSDDWIEPNMLEMMEMKLKETRADLCICGFWIENGALQKEHHFGKDDYSGITALKALIEGRINDNVWNKLYRRELFYNSNSDDDFANEKTDDMLLFPEGKNFEDYYVMHRIMIKAKRVEIITESYYHYRMRLDSITRNYSAKNLIDYAEAHFERYFFLQQDNSVKNQFSESVIMAEAAKGVSKVWRWWYGCNDKEKRENSVKLKEMETFIRSNCPLFGYYSWPFYLRLSSFFMHSRGKISLFILYHLNGAYRKMRPDKVNILQ